MDTEGRRTSQTGTVLAHNFGEGSLAPVSAVLGVIGADGENAEATPPARPRSSRSRRQTMTSPRPMYRHVFVAPPHPQRLRRHRGPCRPVPTRRRSAGVSDGRVGAPASSSTSRGSAHGEQAAPTPPRAQPPTYRPRLAGRRTGGSWSPARRPPTSARRLVRLTGPGGHQQRTRRATPAALRRKPAPCRPRPCGCTAYARRAADEASLVVRRRRRPQHRPGRGGRRRPAQHLHQVRQAAASWPRARKSKSRRPPRPPRHRSQPPHLLRPHPAGRRQLPPGSEGRPPGAPLRAPPRPSHASAAPSFEDLGRLRARRGVCQYMCMCVAIAKNTSSSASPLPMTHHHVGRHLWSWLIVPQRTRRRRVIQRRSPIEAPRRADVRRPPPTPPAKEAIAATTPPGWPLPCPLGHRPWRAHRARTATRHLNLMGLARAAEPTRRTRPGNNQLRQHDLADGTSQRRRWHSREAASRCRHRPAPASRHPWAPPSSGHLG